jgi:hypothetical protein
VDAELVKIPSAALVSQSTSFKTASMHSPLFPMTCTVWDQVEEDLLVVVVVVVVVDVDPAIEPLLGTYPGEVSPTLITDLLRVSYCKSTWVEVTVIVIVALVLVVAVLTVLIGPALYKKLPTTKVIQNCFFLFKSKVVEQVYAELVNTASAALVSQSTSFKTASAHFPSLPITCTVWDQVEEDVVVVLVVDPMVETVIGSLDDATDSDGSTVVVTVVTPLFELPFGGLDLRSVRPAISVDLAPIRSLSASVRHVSAMSKAANASKRRNDFMGFIFSFITE